MCETYKSTLNDEESYFISEKGRIIDTDCGLGSIGWRLASLSALNGLLFAESFLSLAFISSSCRLLAFRVAELRHVSKSVPRCISLCDLDACTAQLNSNVLFSHSSFVRLGIF
jgi:hypothetical protein